MWRIAVCSAVTVSRPPVDAAHLWRCGRQHCAVGRVPVPLQVRLALVYALPAVAAAASVISADVPAQPLHTRWMPAAQRPR